MGETSQVVAATTPFWQEPIFWLTLVLVAVTAYYAWQTHEMVKEMRDARAAQVLPKLVPTLRYIGVDTAFLRVANVGPGPAIDVEFDLALLPDGPIRKWRSPLVTNGEVHDFFPPEKPGTTQPIDAGELTTRFETISLTGSCVDAFGNKRSINESVQIKDVWNLVGAAREVAPQDRMKEIIDQLKAIVKKLP